MTPLELANQYMAIVYGDRDLDDLRAILAPDLEFRGPLFEFDSAAEYMAALESDPPDGFEFEMIRALEDGDAACLLYQFSKPGVSAVMAQLFETDGNRIVRIALVFDTARFIGG